MKEVWKDVKGYEEIYQVSNTGKVRSLDRISAQGARIKGTMLKFGISRSGKGYYQVNLCKNGKTKMFLVHRLVASEFIENENQYPCINHMDENMYNNNADNLEWCTYKYNNNYGTHIEKIQAKMDYKAISVKLRKYHADKHGIDVEQMDFEGNVIGVYDSLREAERQTGVPHGNIARCHKGIYKQAGGYIWRYVE